MTTRSHWVAYPAVLAAGIVVGLFVRTDRRVVEAEARDAVPARSSDPESPPADRALPVERALPGAIVERREEPATDPTSAQHAEPGVAAPCETCRKREHAEDEQLAAEIANDGDVDRIEDGDLRERIDAKLRETHYEHLRCRSAAMDELDRICDRKIERGEFWKTAEGRPPGRKPQASVVMRMCQLPDGTDITIELEEGEALEYSRLRDEWRRISKERVTAVLELLTAERDAARSREGGVTPSSDRP